MSKIAVYGGAGALGRVLVHFFKEKGWSVTSIDLVENNAAHYNAVVNGQDTMEQQALSINQALDKVLEGQKLRALLCVAGGWAGGNAASKSFLGNSDLVWKQSVQSSLIAAHLASKHLENNGVLILTGALAAAEGPTPGMIGYGIAKAAVHHLVQDLAAPSSGIPERAKVAAICPVTLDTPMNRKFMPDADHSTWTPLEAVAKQLWGYVTNEIPLTNGKLIKVVTENGETRFSEI
ncbi:hypothetical protein VTP01DRAFT_4593 [Rhizomucor pusillus]|uniref:uncharacterized protein n=1 Tax=Rhizomucor pusillus TaxID=4840 RepID=UPI003743E9D9